MRCPGSFTRLTTLVLALSLLGISQGGYESDKCSDCEDEGYYSCLSDEEADPNATVGLDNRNLAFLNYVAVELEKQLQAAEIDSNDFYNRLMQIEAIQRAAATLLACISVSIRLPNPGINHKSSSIFLRIVCHAAYESELSATLW
mgnify:CR=1 FL=1